MLIELKKGTWVSCDECLNEGFVGCYDIDCYGNNNICCEECILNGIPKLPLKEVNTKEEEKLQKLFIDCNKDELEEIKCLLRDKGYNVISPR